MELDLCPAVTGFTEDYLELIHLLQVPVLHQIDLAIDKQN